MAMGISRLLDQNVYFWVVSGLRHGIPGELADQDWNDVKVIAGYPSDVESLTLPTVALVRDSFSDSPLQLGSSTDIIRVDTYTAHVFASRDGQRDDLADYVKELIDRRVKTFLDFNDGFGAMDGQSSLGKIDFSFLTMYPVRDAQKQTRAQTHRMNVRFNVEYIYTV